MTNWIAILQMQIQIYEKMNTNGHHNAQYKRGMFHLFYHAEFQ